MPDHPTLKFAAIGLDHRLIYYERLRNDVVDRTETAMPQAHCFKVCELAPRAQAEAKRLA